MKIYQQEILDGVADMVQTTASIAYCSPAAVCTDFNINSQGIAEKIKASSANPKQIDLFYIKSVLVSTGWNKNDDVFSPQSTWAARNTPEDKQFNFMHNENDIIGHITGSYVIDRAGNKIEDDSEMPEEFDIITEAVLYNSWTNPENRSRMSQIIEEIEQNKWFVSMECLFAGFDYAVVDKEGAKKVIARNEQSSFLTKHLRAYGGTGEYEGYKIGRSLRDISFSGKGLVSKPANPRSIILDASKAFSLNEKNVITSVSKGDINMSDNNLLEKQLAEVRSELASAKEENKAIRAQIEAQSDEKIASLETSLAEKEEAFKTLEETVRANEAALVELKSALAEKQAELEAVQSEMMDMKKKEKMAKRKASLVEVGFEDAEAEESLSVYESLDDTAFDSIVAMYKKKMGQYMSKKEEMMKKEEMKKEKAEDASDAVEKVEETVAEEEVSEELFDGVKSTEATLIDASDDNDELEATRASVAQWLTDNVLRNK